MSIKVIDFKWERGKNDLEYIALLENNLEAMLDKFRECSKVAREQYSKGFEKGKEETRKFAEWVAHNSKYNPMKNDIGFAWSDGVHFSTVDVILAEYEREHK